MLRRRKERRYLQRKKIKRKPSLIEGVIWNSSPLPRCGHERRNDN